MEICSGLCCRIVGCYSIGLLAWKESLAIQRYRTAISIDYKLIAKCWKISPVTMKVHILFPTRAGPGNNTGW
jgi:hypothetical protein